LKALPIAENLGQSLESPTLSRNRIYDVDLDSGIPPKVPDGSWGGEIGEDQVVVVPDPDGSFGRYIWAPIRTDGGDEP
jgi:hypothetical protein